MGDVGYVRMICGDEWVMLVDDRMIYGDVGYIEETSEIRYTLFEYFQELHPLEVTEKTLSTVLSTVERREGAEFNRVL